MQHPSVAKHNRVLPADDSLLVADDVQPSEILSYAPYYFRENSPKLASTIHLQKVEVWFGEMGTSEESQDFFIVDVAEIGDSTWLKPRGRRFKSFR